MGLIGECVDKYGHCGLELVEERTGTGPIYKADMHSTGFKMRARKRRGAIHAQ
jgi:hypothetical protein